VAAWSSRSSLQNHTPAVVGNTAAARTEAERGWPVAGARSSRHLGPK
jgi:hypothetical protein